MARRWLKNLNTVSPTQFSKVGFLYWYLIYVCEFTLVDISSPTDFVSLGAGNDCILDFTKPNTATIPSYTFSNADLGRQVALRDETNTTNSGIFTILSVLSPTEVLLDPTLVAFGGLNNNVKWAVIDPNGDPQGTNAFFVLRSTGSGLPWSCKIGYVSFTDDVISVELNANGTWNQLTDTWTTTPSAPVYLGGSKLLSFGVADEQLGGFFLWSEDPVTFERSGVFCGTFASFHSPTALQAPKDLYPVCLIGDDNPLQVNSLDRKIVGPDVGFATKGQVLDSDSLSYTTTYLGNWLRTIDNADMLTVGSAVNPRSGQIDSYNVVMYTSTLLDGQKVRGYIPLLRIVHDSLVNSRQTGVTINDKQVYILQKGLAVEWDGSNPVLWIFHFNLAQSTLTRILVISPY